MTQLIGIQGGKASYHEQAALSLHPNCKLQHYDTFQALFTALKDKQVDTIVCAVSNTHIGPIVESNAELETLQDEYRILNKVSLPIHHALLGLPGSTPADIRRVYSQRPALDQCREFLARTLPDAAVLETEDTALSAKLVAEAGDPANAAIASAAAGKLYDLEPLCSNVQDDPNNTTDFIEIALVDKTGSEM